MSVLIFLDCVVYISLPLLVFVLIQLRWIRNCRESKNNGFNLNFQSAVCSTPVSGKSSNFSLEVSAIRRTHRRIMPESSRKHMAAELQVIEEEEPKKVLTEKPLIDNVICNVQKTKEDADSMKNRARRELFKPNIKTLAIDSDKLFKLRKQPKKEPLKIQRRIRI